ncbi:hypothetical protein BDFB_006950 [Asbolus verrucosus]|uniref:Uncharacterized protein n=1 Tax=Asbolus verrucosus TaxID=1661398 RepID=A0A482WBJ4_ASBVE|nr:hypothetical protein BDFB_006950 [Asbolus verrucosus]
MLSVKNATTINRKPLKRVREAFDLTKGVVVRDLHSERDLIVLRLYLIFFGTWRGQHVFLFRHYEELREKRSEPLQKGAVKPS